MKKQSAGILLYRENKKQLEVMLVHPGGPFWKNKDLGAWSIPKGEFAPGADPLAAARRELKEETGLDLQVPLYPLTAITQKSGKEVLAWYAESDLDVSSINSNEFEMEWPPRSGKTQSFPEVDRAEWFSMKEAANKILPAQLPLLAELEKLVNG